MTIPIFISVDFLRLTVMVKTCQNVHRAYKCSYSMSGRLQRAHTATDDYPVDYPLFSQIPKGIQEN